MQQHATCNSTALDGMRLNSHGLVRDCQAVPRLVRVNGRPPFHMQQGLPLQHYSMVYSMRSNWEQPCEHTGHGHATTEKT